MSTPESVNLTSSEMASLWKEYISLSHSSCMLTYFIAKAEDNEVFNILESTLQLVENNKSATKHLLQSENVPIPIGFDNQDVDVNAPRLFSDSFSLLYIKNLSRVMITTCALMYTMSSRKDIRNHFNTCLKRATDIFDTVSDLLLDKGLYTRPPFIQPPKKSDFIESKDYLSGNNLLEDQRYLNAVEISHIFGNIEANVVGNTLTQAFGQTADLKEIRSIMVDAGKLAEKIINSLTKFLTSSKLPAPMPSETQVFSSAQSPFSDRFVMYQLTFLNAAGISDYATSLAVSMRSDLKRQYMDVLNNTVKLAKKAESLMIENNWIEQPPQQDKILK
ncbi:hypothetical protein HNQ94_001030 [Salirhabdus euzebyi]|uniref:DUF3231 family protein n=1 Tax=Salirhabdus euzebyi TaxID=394506 RepID=A0A841Q2H8_9BACI|nr:DUF3231 family protein [Salirhabdus euzebyi]MBB6452585.1 hypothetical protein [Salirhabdus euzebyi]